MNLLNRLFKNFSLRPLLTIPFVLQIVAAVGLVGYLSFRNGQQAVNDVASQLRREISQQIEQKLLDHIEIPHLINQINAEAVRRGDLQTHDRASERYLGRQIQMLESITWDYYGDQESGAFVGATRNQQGNIETVINDKRTNFQGYYYQLDEHGNRLSLTRITPDIYDARERPWYETAVEANGPVWSSIYPDFALPQLVLSAVRPVYSSADTLLGVVGTDYSLDAIGTFLQNLQIGKTGKAFIIEQDGWLVASSAAEQPYRPDATGETLQRIQAGESQDALIAATGNYLQQNIDLLNQADYTQHDFSFNGARHFVQVSPFQDDYGLDWLIVVVIPESDFMAQINASGRTTLLLCVLALLASIGAGIATARWVTTPILRLNDGARQIAAGHYGTMVDVERCDEVGELAEAFNHMSQQLQIAFESLKVSEQKYRSLFEDSRDTIFITTREGQIVDMNPAGLYRFGLTEEDIHTFNVQDLYANPQDRHTFQQAIEHYGVVTGFEVRMQKRNGGQFDALITATLRQNEEGNITAYQGIIHDISVQKQNERLLAENVRLNTELEVTRWLQRMILPREEELASIHELDIAGYMEPADEVGGDYYDVLPCNGRVTIGIGDVTGHGLESGVLMLMVQTAVRTLLTSGETDPLRFLSILNQTIYQNVLRMQDSRSLSFAMLDYDASGNIRLSGQHEEVLVLRQNGDLERIDTLDLGFPIGLDEDIADFVQTHTFTLQPGDGFILYTDGITEAENAAGEYYGLERLSNVALQHWAAPAADIQAMIIADFRQHIGQQEVLDDITLLVVKRR
jgi:PAS domain S-box-containing protein